MASDREKDSNGLQPGNWTKGFIKVYSLNLSISLGNKTCFIPDYYTILIYLVLENPLGANDIMISRSGNQCPNIIFGKLMELVMPGRHRAFIL
jgi:hypothetical protein